MVNKNQVLQRAIRNDLPRLIESALETQVRQQGGTVQKEDSRITYEIPQTERNSYTYQPKQPKLAQHCRTQRDARDVGVWGEKVAPGGECRREDRPVIVL